MKTRTIRFSLNLRLAAFALLATLMASAAFAQTAAQQPAPKASLIIEQKPCVSICKARRVRGNWKSPTNLAI